MTPSQHGVMADEAKAESLKEEANPYGDVALGVECAWPQTLPAAQAMPSELTP
jgi:hypothetical protein